VSVVFVERARSNGVSARRLVELECARDRVGMLCGKPLQVVGFERHVVVDVQSRQPRGFFEVLRNGNYLSPHA